MKRVLLLAYLFPPIGGGGVQRSVKFVRYLPEFGYEAVVVTGPGGATDRWTPEDETLGDELPPDTEVHRVPGAEPEVSTGWRRLGERIFDLRSPFFDWWIKGAIEVGRRAAEDVDLIVAECVPYVTAEPGMALARELGKPWVADLQDPWALDEIWLYPTAFHRLRDVRRMRKALLDADAVVMNTPEASARVQRRFPELGNRLVASIPNGYDQADFEGAAPKRDDTAFRIVHTGYLYTDVGLRHRRTRRVRRLTGGMPIPGVDLLTRSHYYLVDALERLFARRPELRTRIELHLVGVLSPADREVAARSSATIKIHDYLPHAETVAMTRSADLLFLPMQGLPHGVRAGLVPGKTYEYLASGRPILAPVPEGDARDLLLSAGGAFVCDPDDADAMSRIIEEQVARAERGEEAPRDERVLRRYERRQLTAGLADVFDRVLAERPAEPAATATRTRTPR